MRKLFFLPFIFLILVSNYGCVESGGQATTSVNVSLPPAQLFFSQSSNDFGIIFVGQSVDLPLTIVHSGGVTASSLSITGLSSPFEFAGGSFPGTGGTCATQVASGMCTVVIRYTPLDPDEHDQSITLEWNDGYGTTRTASTLLEGFTKATLLIESGGTYDVGDTLKTTTLEKTLTVSHQGSEDATSITGNALSSPFAWKGGSYPGTGGTCSGTLLKGASCTLVVLFTPPTYGTQSGPITLNYNNGVAFEDSTTTLEGMGLYEAVLSLNRSTGFDFGIKALTSSNDVTYTLSYSSGDVSATGISIGEGLAAPFSFKGGSFPGTGGTCTATLASGSCTIIVSFDPTVSTDYNEQFRLDYHDGLNSQSITRNIEGKGRVKATISMSGAGTYDFGIWQTGTVRDHTYTITYDSGEMTANLSALGLQAPMRYKGGSYPGTGGTCGNTISSGSCTINIQYAPTVPGDYSKTLTVQYNDGLNSSNFMRTLLGKTEAKLDFSGSSPYDYGNVTVGNSPNVLFTLDNTGGVTATGMGGSGLAGDFAYTGGSYPGTGGNCGTTLAAGNDCTIDITYAPSGSGADALTYTMSYNDGYVAQNETLDLEGEGLTKASLSISDGATYSFGNVIVGATGIKTFTVTKTGQTNATSVSESGLASPYEFRDGTYPGTGGTCGNPITSSCTIVVTYEPGTQTTHNDTIVLNYNDGVSSTSANRAITGVGISPAILDISDGATFNYGTQTVGSSSDKTFTITNNGDVQATSISGAGLSAPYSFKGGSFPGTGGDCAVSLLAGNNCSIVVTYDPNSHTTHNDSIEIDFNNGLTTTQSTRAVTGQGNLIQTSQLLFNLVAPSSIAMTTVNNDVNFETELINNNYHTTTIDDVNSDFTNDYIVGDPYRDMGGGTYRGVVDVKNGDNDTTIYSVQGSETDDFFGASVTSLGDVNSDGVGDYAVGAPKTDGVGSRRGKVYILDGTDGSVVGTSSKTTDDGHYGLFVHNISDINSDSKDDILVGEYEIDGGNLVIKKVYGISGADGSEIFNLTKIP